MEAERAWPRPRGGRLTPDHFHHGRKFIVEAAQVIRENVTTEGLFRKSGELRRQAMLRKLVERGESLAKADVHDVTSLVKTFFRLLPVPLVPDLFHDPLLHCVQLPDDTREEAIQALCFSLPAPHLSCLRYFMLLLAHIADHVDSNRMSPINLAVVVTPSVVRLKSRSKLMSEEELRALPKQTALVEYLICHAQSIGNMTREMHEKSLKLAESIISKKMRKKRSKKGKDEQKLREELHLTHVRVVLNLVADLHFRPNSCASVSDSNIVDTPSRFGKLLSRAFRKRKAQSQRADNGQRNGQQTTSKESRAPVSKHRKRRRRRRATTRNACSGETQTFRMEPPGEQMSLVLGRWKRQQVNFRCLPTSTFSILESWSRAIPLINSPACSETSSTSYQTFTDLSHSPSESSADGESPEVREAAVEEDWKSLNGETSGLSPNAELNAQAGVGDLPAGDSGPVSKCGDGELATRVLRSELPGGLPTVSSASISSPSPAYRAKSSDSQLMSQTSPRADVLPVSPPTVLHLTQPFMHVTSLPVVLPESAPLVLPVPESPILVALAPPSCVSEKLPESPSVQNTVSHSGEPAAFEPVQPSASPSMETEEQSSSDSLSMEVQTFLSTNNPPSEPSESPEHRSAEHLASQSAEHSGLQPVQLPSYCSCSDISASKSSELVPPQSAEPQPPIDLSVALQTSETVHQPESHPLDSQNVKSAVSLPFQPLSAHCFDTATENTVVLEKERSSVSLPSTTEAHSVPQSGEGAACQSAECTSEHKGHSPPQWLFVDGPQSQSVSTVTSLSNTLTSPSEHTVMDDCFPSNSSVVPSSKKSTGRHPSANPGACFYAEDSNDIRDRQVQDRKSAGINLFQLSDFICQHSRRTTCTPQGSPMNTHRDSAKEVSACCSQSWTQSSADSEISFLNQGQCVLHNARKSSWGFPIDECTDEVQYSLLARDGACSNVQNEAHASEILSCGPVDIMTTRQLTEENIMTQKTVACYSAKPLVNNDQVRRCWLGSEPTNAILGGHACASCRSACQWNHRTRHCSCPECSDLSGFTPGAGRGVLVGSLNSIHPCAKYNHQPSYFHQKESCKRECPRCFYRHLVKTDYQHRYSIREKIASPVDATCRYHYEPCRQCGNACEQCSDHDSCGPEEVGYQRHEGCFPHVRPTCHRTNCNGRPFHLSYGCCGEPHVQGFSADGNIQKRASHQEPNSGRGLCVKPQNNYNDVAALQNLQSPGHSLMSRRNEHDALALRRVRSHPHSTDRKSYGQHYRATIGYQPRVGHRQLMEQGCLGVYSFSDPESTLTSNTDLPDRGPFEEWEHSHYVGFGQINHDSQRENRKLHMPDRKESNEGTKAEVDPSSSTEDELRELREMFIQQYLPSGDMTEEEGSDVKTSDTTTLETTDELDSLRSKLEMMHIGPRTRSAEYEAYQQQGNSNVCTETKKELQQDASTKFSHSYYSKNSKSNTNTLAFNRQYAQPVDHRQEDAPSAESEHSSTFLSPVRGTEMYTPKLVCSNVTAAPFQRVRRTTLSSRIVGIEPWISQEGSRGLSSTAENSLPFPSLGTPTQIQFETTNVGRKTGLPESHSRQLDDTSRSTARKARSPYRKRRVSSLEDFSTYRQHSPDSQSEADSEEFTNNALAAGASASGVYTSCVPSHESILTKSRSHISSVYPKLVRIETCPLHLEVSEYSVSVEDHIQTESASGTDGEDAFFTVANENTDGLSERCSGDKVFTSVQKLNNPFRDGREPCLENSFKTKQSVTKPFYETKTDKMASDLQQRNQPNHEGFTMVPRRAFFLLDGDIDIS